MKLHWASQRVNKVEKEDYIRLGQGQTKVKENTIHVQVSMPKPNVFIRSHALSYAPAQIITPTSASQPSGSPINDVSKYAIEKLTKASLVRLASNTVNLGLMALFYTPKVGEGSDNPPNQILLTNEESLLIGGFSRSTSTISKEDFLTESQLRDIASVNGTAITGVRYRTVENEQTGQERLVGYNVEQRSDLNRVRVRFVKRDENGTASFSDIGFQGRFIWSLQSQTANYYPTNQNLEPVILNLNANQAATLIHDGGDVGYALPPTPLPEPSEIWALPNPIPESIDMDSLPGSPIEDEQGGWIESVPIEEHDFNDYILVDPLGEFPAIYIFFKKQPVKDLEVDYYGNFAGRPRGGLYEVDHIPSEAAIRLYLKSKFPDMPVDQIDEAVKKVASIAIPKEVHQICSQTYGGRNNSWLELDNDEQIRRKKYDAQNLREAVERNWEANSECLEALGYDKNLLDEKLQELHKLNIEKGWYR